MNWKSILAYAGLLFLLQCCVGFFSGIFDLGDWSMPDPSSPSCYAPRCSRTWRGAWHSTASRMPASSWSSTPPKQLWSRRCRHPNRPYFSYWNGYNCSPPQASACSLAGCSSPSPINVDCSSRVPTKHPSADVNRDLIDAHAQDHQVSRNSNSATHPGNAYGIRCLRCASGPTAFGSDSRCTRPCRPRGVLSSPDDPRTNRREYAVAFSACGTHGRFTCIPGSDTRSGARAQRTLEHPPTDALRQVANVRALLRPFLQRHRLWAKQLCQSPIRQAA